MNLVNPFLASSSPVSVNQTFATGIQVINGSTVHNLNLPPVVNPNDLILAILCQQGGAIGQIPTPSGWTKDLEKNDDNIRGILIFHKISDGTEGGSTLAFPTAGNMSIHCWSERFSAGTYNISTPIQTAATSSFGTTGSIFAPSLTSSLGSKSHYWEAIYCINNGTGGTISSFPFPDNNASTNNAGVAGRCSKIQTQSSQIAAGVTMSSASQFYQYTTAMLAVGAP